MSDDFVFCFLLLFFCCCCCCFLTAPYQSAEMQRVSLEEIVLQTKVSGKTFSLMLNWFPLKFIVEGDLEWGHVPIAFLRFSAQILVGSRNFYPRLWILHRHLLVRTARLTLSWLIIHEKVGLHFSRYLKGPVPGNLWIQETSLKWHSNRTLM